MYCPKCKSKNTVYGDRFLASDGRILYHRCLDCKFKYDHKGEGDKITWKAKYEQNIMEDILDAMHKLEQHNNKATDIVIDPELLNKDYILETTLGEKTIIYFLGMKVHNIENRYNKEFYIFNRFKCHPVYTVGYTKPDYIELLKGAKQTIKCQYT